MMRSVTKFIKILVMKVMGTGLKTESFSVVPTLHYTAQMLSNEKQIQSFIWAQIWAWMFYCEEKLLLTGAHRSWHRLHFAVRSALSIWCMATGLNHFNFQTLKQVKQSAIYLFEIVCYRLDDFVVIYSHHFLLDFMVRSYSLIFVTNYLNLRPYAIHFTFFSITHLDTTDEDTPPLPKWLFITALDTMDENTCPYLEDWRRIVSSFHYVNIFFNYLVSTGSKYYPISFHHKLVCVSCMSNFIARLNLTLPSLSNL